MEAAVREIGRLQERLCQLRAELRAPLEEEALGAETIEILTGRVGGERVALLVQSISEIVAMPEVSVLPEVAPWITGLLDLRGRLIPLIDIEARIARGSRTARASDFVVVCADREVPLGLVVSGIEKVQALAADQFAEPPADVGMAPYVLRVAQDQRGKVLLLSVERLACTSNLPAVPE